MHTNNPGKPASQSASQPACKQASCMRTTAKIIIFIIITGKIVFFVFLNRLQRNRRFVTLWRIIRFLLLLLLLFLHSAISSTSYCSRHTFALRICARFSCVFLFLFFSLCCCCCCCILLTISCWAHVRWRKKLEKKICESGKFFKKISLKNSRKQHKNQ